MKILLTVFLLAVPLTVFQKLLLTLKPYLLGELQGVLVLLTFLWIAWIEPYIEIEVLFLSLVGDLILHSASRRPVSIYDGISGCVKYRGFMTTEIEL